VLVLFLAPISHADPPSPTTALETAATALGQANIRLGSYVSEQEANDARKAGLNEAKARRLLEPLVSACLADEKACEPFGPLAGRESRARKVSDTLAYLLGELGTASSLPLLDRMDARSWTAASLAAKEIADRAFSSYRAGFRCTMPSAAEVRQQRASLDDFVVIRKRGGRLLAETLSSAEKDDLAYFLSAVSESRPEVGTTEEGGGLSGSGGPNPNLETLYGQVQTAKKDGDPQRVVRHAEAYLKTLGYPGRIQSTNAFAWGGARFSYVMRDLADAYERLGRHREAATLFRRANPSGGMCGTSVAYRWKEQVRGVIRNEEQSGDCRATVAERLLGIDERRYPTKQSYGTQELARDGYDVGRLYRGALLTLNRDLPSSELEAALKTAPASIRARALRRYRQKGAEDWERRVYAVEGWAVVGRAAALPGLVGSVSTGVGQTRQRALYALGRLALKPEYDPCGSRRSYMGTSSSTYHREITSLGESCREKLSNQQLDALARQLVRFANAPEVATRTQVAETLGLLGSPVALPALTRLLQDPAPTTGTLCTSEGKTQRCRPNQPVREAAQEAIERIRKVARQK